MCRRTAGRLDGNPDSAVIPDTLLFKSDDFIHTDVRPTLAPGG